MASEKISKTKIYAEYNFIDIYEPERVKIDGKSMATDKECKFVKIKKKRSCVSDHDLLLQVIENQKNDHEILMGVVKLLNKIIVLNNLKAE